MTSAKQNAPKLFANWKRELPKRLETKEGTIPCFISVIASKELEEHVGSQSVNRFYYFVGKPVEADSFAIRFYDDPNWLAKGVPPLPTDDPNLPKVTFDPLVPFLNTESAHEASFTLDIPADTTYQNLYVELLLVKRH